VRAGVPLGGIHVDTSEILRNQRVATRFLRTEVQDIPIPFQYGMNSIERVAVFEVFTVPVTSSGIKIGPIVTMQNISAMESLVQFESVESYINNAIEAPLIETYREFNMIVRSARVSSFPVYHGRQIVLYQQLQSRRRDTIQDSVTLVEDLIPRFTFRPLRSLFRAYHVNGGEFIRTGIVEETTGHGYPIYFSSQFANEIARPLIIRSQERSITQGRRSQMYQQHVQHLADSIERSYNNHLVEGLLQPLL
jgi:hypothetical protein